MACKRALWALLLTLVILAGLTVPANAYAPQDTVGQIPILLGTDDGDRIKNAANQACSLGSAAADAARAAAGADLAILNGGDLGAGLQPGAVTWETLQHSFSTSRTLATVTVTAEELWQILETGVSHAVLDEHLKIDREASSFDGFPQISGFRFTYDMSAPVGERIYSVTLDGGETLDRSDTARTFTLCATEYMLTGGYGYPVPAQPLHPLGLDTAQALADAVAQGTLDADAYEGSARIRVIGCGDDTLLATSPMAVILFLAVLVLATAGLNLRRKLKFQRT